jgi:DNA-binding LacI/PurR family transcriptional regulator
MDDLGANVYQRFLQPMFERALADTTITAWVCATDSIATQALAFLENRDIAVPGRISLVGFDNSPLSTMYGLTSYDFDQQNLFNHAISFAIGRRGSAESPGTAVECPGTLIERQTTGKAKLKKEN